MPGGEVQLVSQPAAAKVHGQGAEVAYAVDGAEVGVVLVFGVPAGTGQDDQVVTVDGGTGVHEAAVHASPASAPRSPRGTN